MRMLLKFNSWLASESAGSTATLNQWSDRLRLKPERRKRELSKRILSNVFETQLANRFSLLLFSFVFFHPDLSPFSVFHFSLRKEKALSNLICTNM
ncbi:hypothetical protein VTK56DRAFT_290 [Thermocarpiscus australiensis]